MKSTATSSPKSQPADWNVWNAAKRTAIEYLAVFISGVGFLLSVITLAIVLTLGYMLYTANEQIAILEIRIDRVERNQ